MKKRRLLTITMAAAMAISLCACSETAQTGAKLNEEIIAGDKAVSSVEAHFKETDKGERFFVTANGVVYTKADYTKTIEQAGFDPDTIATLDFNAAEDYKAAPEVKSSQKPEYDDIFYHNKAGADITYGQYKRLLGAFRPAEINALDSELLELLFSEKLPEPLIETNGHENTRKVLDLDGKRVVYISDVKTYAETNGGKLTASLEAGGFTKAAAFCEITNGSGTETKLFDTQSSELKAEGNKLTLEYDAGDFYVADFGIIAVCDK